MRDEAERRGPRATPAPSGAEVGDDSALQIPDRWIGRSVGGCRLTRLLGAGGMGAVYRGEHERLGKAVAVKLLPKGLAREPERAERFLREARAAAKLEHPRIVTVYDVGETPDAWFITMRLVDGESAAARVRRAGPLPPREALRIVGAMAEALDVAHRRGIIHRDVKPENILCDTEGDVLLADFGLVRDLEAGSNLSASGQVLGTPAYMSPEQARGEKVDPRSDLYSLGATAYYLVAGQPPFTGDTALATALKHIMEDPEPLGELVPGTPPALEDFVATLMAKSPDARPASAAAVVAQVADLLDGGLDARPARGNPLGRLAIAAVVLCAGAGGVFLAVRGARGSSSPAPPPTVVGQPPATPGRTSAARLREIEECLAARRYDDAIVKATRLLKDTDDPAVREAATKARATAVAAAADVKLRADLVARVAEFRVLVDGTADIAGVERFGRGDGDPVSREQVRAFLHAVRGAIAWVGDPRIGAIEAGADGLRRATVELTVRRTLAEGTPEDMWSVGFVLRDERFEPDLGRPERVAQVALTAWCDRMLSHARAGDRAALVAEAERGQAMRVPLPEGKLAAHMREKAATDFADKLIETAAQFAKFEIHVQGVTLDPTGRTARAKLRFETVRRDDPAGVTADEDLLFTLRDGHWVLMGSLKKWLGGREKPERPAGTGRERPGRDPKPPRDGDDK